MTKKPKKKIKKKIKKIENKTERRIDSIMAREKKSFPLFLKYHSKKQITFIKKEIKKVVEVYPPFMQKFVMTWLVVAYCSIFPGAGTTSLLFWGSIAKIITWFKK